MVHKWLKIFSIINANNDLGKDNIIKKIKEELEATYPSTYAEWGYANFSTNHTVSSEECTLLHLAARYGYTKIVRALIENGADVNVVDEYKRTPLHLATWSGYTEIVEVLIENKANINIVDDEYKKTPLHLAAENGRTEIVRALIDNGANVNVMDKKRLTPLSFAAENGYKEIAYTLMEKGADPLLGNKNRTLKYLAELTENDNLKQPRKEQRDDEYESLKYSLLCRDNRSLIDVVGEDTFDNLMCIWFANTSGLTLSQKELNKELFSILQAYPSFSDEGDYDENGYIARLTKFLRDNENNQDLEEILNLRRGESKLTVLHIVSSIARVEEEYDDSVALLLKAGADPNAKDDRGKTPLHYATGPNSIASLLGKGASPNEQDNEGKTPLHCIASTDYNDLVSLLLDNEVRSDICDKQGKTPLDIAIDNCSYYAEEYLLTDDQEVLRQEVYDILDDVDEDNSSSLNEGLTELKKFLGKHKDNQDLKRILNLHSCEGKSQIFQHIKNIFHSNETFCKVAKGLLLAAGAIDYEELKGLDRKEHLPKSRTLWNNLILNQQKELRGFLGEVNTAQDINQLGQVIDEAIESGIRFNFPHQGKLYGEMYESKYSFMDYVIKKIKDLSKSEKNPKVASDIVCKLISRGAVLYNVNSIDLINTLELECENHKTNVIKAHESYINRALRFMEIVKSAATGKVKDAKVDNSTLYLEYSEDSTIHVAKITDGAKDLGLTQGEIGYGRDVIKIGKSEVEIITINDIRYYTDLADGSDIVLTFRTSQGELDVRLYPDKQNREIIRIETDKEMLEKLEDCGEEIGENCRLGVEGLSVKKAIEQGFFTRSGRLVRSEAMGQSNEQKKGEWCERISKISNSGQTACRSIW